MRIRLTTQQAGATRARLAARHGQKGFTLTEIMVAGCILGFSVASLYSAYSFGFVLIRASREYVRADQILLQKMETLRVYPWPQTAPSGGIIPGTFTADFAPGAAQSGVVYNGMITIKDAPVSESYSNTLRQVTVSVSWNSGVVARSRSMTTFISQNGIEAL
jgi:Tfp pilus assembly protein PilE